MISTIQGPAISRSHPIAGAVFQGLSMSNSHRARIWLATCLAAAWAVSSAGAVPPAKKNSNGQAQAASHQQLAVALHNLQSIKLTLERADHDYGGHRAAAVRDIGAAERQLREAMHHQVHHHHGVHPVSHVGGRGVGAHPEPQALSDAQLAASIPALNSAIGVLSNANHDYGGHRTKAINDLKAAIIQLELALKFSQARNQNKK